ncbi:DUF935 domain-containing protein [Roseovarius sp. E0-M6]|uniref:DUF935 domain-containing protein n=1 Tax=Roseovarius sp. E0-M6 TaxID=3127118 RepID=UPI00300FB190
MTEKVRTIQPGPVFYDVFLGYLRVIGTNLKDWCVPHGVTSTNAKSAATGGWNGPNPVRRPDLKREVAAPTTTGVRSPLAGTPADGLDPHRLATILRQADMGDPLRYLELAEIIEERDPHYLGVLGTRKRSVSQVDITVEPGGESAHDQKLATMVRDWLKRDELRDEVFDILDALGKGYSHTEIIWDTSMGQWFPERLEWRDPRWFRFVRHDLATPTMLDEHGQEVPYPAFKFVFARMKAKSGLALRSGLARIALWGYLFKKYTERDWAIFTQTYGQPIRVGKYGPGASEQDRDTLFRAVADIGGDCAAIIPESMMLEFVEAKNVGSSTDHYERRADWLDKQISKLVLGQTSTTDAEVGGLGSGKEHREVQEVIETADCSALQAILNRDLIRPWIDLEFGPQTAYPSLKIERVEDEDLAHFAEAITPFIDRGLRVSTQSIYDKFGLPKAKNSDEVLRPEGQQPASPVETPRESGFKYPLNTHEPDAGADTAIHAERASVGRSAPLDPAVDRLAQEAAPEMEAMLGRIEAMLEAAGSLEEFREMLISGFPDLDTNGLARIMADAMMGAYAGGRAAVVDEDIDG